MAHEITGWFNFGIRERTIHPSAHARTVWNIFVGLFIFSNKVQLVKGVESWVKLILPQIFKFLFKERSFLETMGIGQYLKEFAIELIYMQSCTFRHFTKKLSEKICLKRHYATFFCRNSLPNTTLERTIKWMKFQ